MEHAPSFALAFAANEDNLDLALGYADGGTQTVGLPRTLFLTEQVLLSKSKASVALGLAEQGPLSELEELMEGAVAVLSILSAGKLRSSGNSPSNEVLTD